MASPFTWTTNKPADTDQVSVFPAKYRADTATLLAVLGTLIPSGSPTVGFRIYQATNEIMLTTNVATLSTLTITQDDVTVPSWGVLYSAANDDVIWYNAKAGATTLVPVLKIALSSSSSAMANYLEFLAVATGSTPQVSALGSDTNVGLNLVTQGTGTVQANGVIIIPRNIVALAPAGVVNTTSLTLVSTGQGVGPITPKYQTSLRVRMTGTTTGNTSGDGSRMAVYRSTAGTPAAGNAPAGGDVQIWLGIGQTQIGTNGGFAFQQACEVLDTGLTAGTAYYYYIAQEAITGGTASVENCSMIVEE